MNKKVAMIGVGKLGEPVAEVMANYYDVVGYDVDTKTPTFPMLNTIEETVKDKDFIFIAAPTPHDPIYGGETPSSHLPNKDFDYTIAKDLLNEINKYVNSSQLVILISTVLPGTVRNELSTCITNARFIYNPYLIAMGTVSWDFVNPEMVIIGTENGDLTGDAKELIDFYKPMMKNDPRYEVGTWDEAESIKIFYNTFISTKLALVNMIQDVAETNGNINVDVVTNALAKSTHRIMGPSYMKAGLGDAGACHPRDNIALRYLADRLDLGYDLFDAIMRAREVQAERMALRCLKNGKNITIIGKAYKPNVPYTNGSASMLIGHYIEKHGGNVHYYDENTNDTNLNLEWTEVYLIGYWESWVENVIRKIKPESVLIDPWRNNLSLKHRGEVIHYGNTKKKIESLEPPNYGIVKIVRMQELLITVWPELKEHINKIHLIDSGIMTTNEPVFHLRSTETIIKDILNAKKNGATKFFLYNVSEGVLPHMVSKIHRIANLLEGVIDSKDFFYVSGSPDCQEVYDKMYNRKISGNTYWKSKISILSGHFFQLLSQSMYAEYNNKIEYIVEEKNKKFLCFNNMAREHRARLLEFMLANNYVKDGYYSFEGATPGNSDWKHIMNILNDDFKHIKRNSHIFPMKLNLKLKETVNLNPYCYNCNITEDDLKYFNNSYFSIVTETMFYDESKGRFQRHATEDCIFITEKTFKCIVTKHPFILLARPGMLAELKKMGYKTFSPIIDETYDTVQNDDDRLKLILTEIDKLMKKPTKEWAEWQSQIKDIVEYNHTHFYSTRDYAVTENIEKYFIE